GISRIVLQQFAVFLQRGTASTSVGYDGVVLSVQQSIDVPPRQLSRIFPQTGVDVQRATASLGSGDGDFAAILAEHSNGSVIEAREANVCDATAQKRNPITFGIFGFQ